MQYTSLFAKEVAQLLRLAPSVPGAPQSAAVPGGYVLAIQWQAAAAAAAAAQTS